jgi:Ca2+-binding RTX toxin-like protein
MFPRNTRCAVGGRFDDVLLGTPRDDDLNAGDGADLVLAGGRKDDVWSGWTVLDFGPAGVDRADRMYLGPGDDRGNGGSGRDRLYGGPGSDDILGGPDGDYLDGGPGDDSLYSGSGHCMDMGESRPPAFLSEMLTDNAPNEVFGRSGNDFLAGDLGNDRLDGGLGFDSGTGGYHDGRIDWITSVERPDECNSPPLR